MIKNEVNNDDENVIDIVEPYVELPEEKKI